MSSLLPLQIGRSYGCSRDALLLNGKFLLPLTPPSAPLSPSPRPAPQIGRSYGSSRDALLLNGKFLLAQLKAMSEQHQGAAAGSKAAVNKATAFHDTPFAVALAAEVSGQGGQVMVLCPHL